MGLVVAPIVEGKLEAWKRWTKDLTGPNKREFDDFNKRYGLTRHDVWLVETPAGPLAVVLHEGPGGDTMMQKVGHSENSYDKNMVRLISDFHGMDMNSPPPGPMPVKMT